MGKDYSDIAFKDDGRLKLLIIVGTRPEVIRLSDGDQEVPAALRLPMLAHTGQNYDYNAQRHLLPRPVAGRPGRLPGRRGRGPGRDHGQHHRGLVQADGPGPARRAADPGRHQFLPVGHRRQAPAYPHFPHGGGQPLQGRVPAGGDQPPHRGRDLRREHGLLRARPPLPAGHRLRQGADLRHRLPHGGGAAPANLENRGVGRPDRGLGPKKGELCCCLPTARRTSTRRQTS